LIYGNQEEKYELTFRLIDIERKSFFTYEEFYEMIMSMLHTWNNITGHHYSEFPVCSAAILMFNRSPAKQQTSHVLGRCF